MSVFVAGSAAGVLGLGWSRRRDAQPDGAGAAEVERGTLAWALRMADASDDQLVAAAGDLERVSARHRLEARLVPVFERLLDAALRSELPAADESSTCAIRSLIRLGRADLAADRERDLATRPEFTQAAGALERAQRAARRR